MGKVKMSIAVLVFFWSGMMLAQDKDQKPVRREVLKKSYFGFSGAYGSFQDAKFSAVQYGGAGGAFSWGTQRDAKNYHWNINVTTLYNGLTTSDYAGTGFNANGRANFQYMRKLNESYQIGGKWQMGGISFNNFKHLGNNSINVIYNTTLMAVGAYTRELTDNLQLKFELGIGLLAGVRESTSFAYNAPPKVLEEGIFNFQNNATTSPLSIRYAEFSPIGKLNQIETSLSVDFKKRWNFFYDWSLFNYRSVAGYPITQARHLLGVKFYYINKKKVRR